CSSTSDAESVPQRLVRCHVTSRYRLSSSSEVQPDTEHRAPRIDEESGLSKSQGKQVVGRQAFFGCVIEHIEHIQKQFDTPGSTGGDDLRHTHVEQRLRRQTARPARLEQNALRALWQRYLRGCRPRLAAESLQI